MGLLTYYLLVAGFFYFASPWISDSYSTTVDLNNSAMNPNEIDTGGVFGTGVSFTRFAGFVAFGIGLPDSTPNTFRYVFALIMSSVTIFTIGFVVASIWNG